MDDGRRTKRIKDKAATVEDKYRNDETRNQNDDENQQGNDLVMRIGNYDRIFIRGYL